MKPIVLGLCLSLAAFASPAARAAAPQAYRPAIAQFDGSNSIILPPDDSLDLEIVGTIEFWAAAGWDEGIGYDPALLSYMGEAAPRYSVHITADKQKIGLFAGDEWDAIDFDFSDGKLHYVAIVTYEGLTEVYIDGEARGVIGAGYAEDIIGDALVIGSLNGVDAPFIGALAGLRIWATTVEDETLGEFSAVDILSAKGKTHPDIEDLVGIGLFEDGQRGFGLTGEPQSYLTLAAEVESELAAEDDEDAEETAAE